MNTLLLSNSAENTQITIHDPHLRIAQRLASRVTGHY